jgi:hypothetical protein
MSVTALFNLFFLTNKYTQMTNNKNMELELKQALSIMELEERFEMTAAAADALRCGDNQSCTIIVQPAPKAEVSL